MATPTLTGEAATDWPARFGSWAERAPDLRSLCRSARTAPWRLRPPDLASVRAVLAEATRTRTPLYPVSRGMNWGYGSHLPARNGSVILDLSGLDRIGELDPDSQSVRIEPGVTQAALAAHLKAHAPQFAINVTGSGAATSILGNALERGIGYSGERDRELFALEVLLADGTLVGPAPGRNHPARVHPAGLSQDALFFQTNYAVVVGARLRLRVRQEAEEAVVIRGSLEAVMTTLKRAYDAQLVSAPTHIAEPGRSKRLGHGLLRASLGREPTAREVERCFPEQHGYSALVPIHGRKALVRAALRELRRIGAPGLSFARANARKLEFGAKLMARVGARYQAARIRALRPILALAWGEPGDAGLTSLDRYEGGNPDLAGRGAIYGNAVASFAQFKGPSEIIRRHWPDSAFTWIVLDSRCVLTISTLHFDDAQAEAAHAANAKIIGELRAAGLPPYRLDINTAAAPGAEAITGRLKAAFDPLGLIAPGRYEAWDS